MGLVNEIAPPAREQILAKSNLGWHYHKNEPTQLDIFMRKLKKNIVM